MATDEMECLAFLFRICFHTLKRDMGVPPMLEAQDKKRPGYRRFLVPGNEHGRDARVTLDVVKQLLSRVACDARQGAPVRRRRRAIRRHETRLASEAAKQERDAIPFIGAHRCSHRWLKFSTPLTT